MWMAGTSPRLSGSILLASKERALFSRLLEKVLPMQLDVKDTTKQVYTDPTRRLLGCRSAVCPCRRRCSSRPAWRTRSTICARTARPTSWDNRRFNEETGDSD
jgi:hypothetical protein